MPNPKLHEVFEDKSWSGDKGAPRSGHGSSLRRTRRLRKALPGFLRRHDVKTFIDAPCGDWTFMQAVDLSMLTSYIGCDISHALLDANQAEFGTDTTTFRFLDITCDPLPEGDMLMCRECLIHLRDINRWAFFENFAASQIDWLLLTIDYVSANIPLTADGGIGESEVFVNGMELLIDASIKSCIVLDPTNTKADAEKLLPEMLEKAGVANIRDEEGFGGAMVTRGDFAGGTLNVYVDVGLDGGAAYLMSVTPGT